MTDDKPVKHIIRVATTDLDGNKPIPMALIKIKGIGFAFSNVICKVLNFDKNKKAGTLSPEEVNNIEDLIKNPSKYNIPSWLLNRRGDYETNEDKHVVVSDLKLQKEFDVKRLQKTKSYRGLRLAQGLPVRGQRTRSHFKRGGRKLGVQKKVKVGKK
jgi:small subunit ribosomal protein S13